MTPINKYYETESIISDAFLNFFFLLIVMLQSFLQSCQYVLSENEHACINFHNAVFDQPLEK